jgi:DNA mismatch endonuclease, patch repair protein
MVDRLAPEERSRLMAAVRAIDTAPEMAVRRLAHRMGYRFRLHRRDLPGNPDLVFPRLRKIVFVHGCFWHRHRGCKRTRMPASRREYWARKFATNVERDEKNQRLLQGQGWSVLVIWECETDERPLLAGRLRSFLGPVAAPPAKTDLASAAVQLPTQWSDRYSSWLLIAQSRSRRDSSSQPLPSEGGIRRCYRQIR